MAQCLSGNGDVGGKGLNTEKLRNGDGTEKNCFWLVFSVCPLFLRCSVLIPLPPYTPLPPPIWNSWVPADGTADRTAGSRRIVYSWGVHPEPARVRVALHAAATRSLRKQPLCLVAMAIALDFRRNVNARCSGASACRP